MVVRKRLARIGALAKKVDVQADMVTSQVEAIDLAKKRLRLHKQEHAALKGH